GRAADAEQLTPGDAVTGVLAGASGDHEHGQFLQECTVIAGMPRRGQGLTPGRQAGGGGRTAAARHPGRNDHNAPILNTINPRRRRRQSKNEAIPVTGVTGDTPADRPCSAADARLIMPLVPLRPVAARESVMLRLLSV